MPKFDILTLGDLVADLVVPIRTLPLRPQEHQPASDIAIEAGGTGNTLVMAARLGLRPKALGSVGDDYYGQQVLKQLADVGVDVESVVIPSGSRTATAIVLIDEAAQHVFVGMPGTGMPQPFDPAWEAFVRESAAIFMAGYAMRPDAAFSPAGIMTCLEIAQAQQIPIFFDLGPAAFLINRQDIQAVTNYATVFLATQEETAAWIGLADPLEAAHHFLAQEATQLAIIKLGAEGCLLATAEEHVHVPGFPIKVRDTAGAGDAFAPACIYGYLKGWPLEKIGLLANAVGAMAVAKLGTGTMLPQREEIAALLRQHGHALLDS